MINKIAFGIMLYNAALIASSPVDIVRFAIGGVEVESPLMFPYQTAIYARRDSGTSFCSGSILSSTFVITCAHCLTGSHSASIYFGSKRLSALDFSRNQVVPSENYRIHPEYSQLVNDVALIRISSIEFSGELHEIFWTKAKQ